LTTVWLSGSGRAALSTIQSASTDVYDTAFKDMDDKQMRRLLEALQTLDENLSSALSSEP
jgi:hypothetical protein